MDLTTTEFNNCFCIIKNNADGNCLFESIENLLVGSLYELKMDILPLRIYVQWLVTFIENLIKILIILNQR
jgi:hypothetical protein